MLLRLQLLLQPGNRLASCKRAQRAAEILLLDAGLLRNAEQRVDTQIRVGRSRVFRPADDRRIA